jgi:Arc/MetJ family transcription regulator
MRTNIDIDDKLMAEAQKRSAGATKRAIVEEALRLLIQTRRQGALRKWRGKVKWEGDLDAMRTDLPAD